MRTTLGNLYSKFWIFISSKGIKFYPLWVRMLNCIILGSEQEAKIFSVVKEAEIKALYKKIIELVMESETASQLLLSCPDLDKEERASIEKRLSLAKGILVSFENNSSGDPFLIHALEEEVKKIKDCPKSK